MREIDQKKLSQEIVAYRFPEGGGEYVKNQIARHQSVFDNNEEYQYLLMDNEQIFKNNSLSAIVGTDDSGEPIYMARYSHGDIISHEEVVDICDSSNNRKVFLIFHGDLDGSTAAAISGRIFHGINVNKEKEVIYLHHNYTQASMNSIIKRVHQVSDGIDTKCIAIIVDLALSPQDLAALSSLFERMIFIDHHRRSIDSLQKASFDRSTKVTCLVDIRYSAAYLCYILFANIIKERLGMELNETFPAMVSAMDNAQAKTFRSKLVSVKVSKENMESLKHVRYCVGSFQKQMYILTDPTKLLGRYIYIENPVSDDRDEFPNLAMCGSNINQYFIESADLYPYINDFYDKVLTDPSKVYDIVMIGAQLRTLELKKLQVLNLKEGIYSASFKGKIIRGINTVKFDAFSIIPGLKHAQIIMKYSSNTMLSAYVRTYESILKGSSIAEALSDFFTYEKKNRLFGHTNIATAYASLRKIDILFKSFSNKSINPDLIEKYPFLYEVFDNMYMSTPKHGFRANESIRKLFKIVSTIIFTVYQIQVQTKFEAKNGN